MALQLQVEIAVAKVSKYAVSESGDTVESVERPQGGISVVVADGQRSGRSAKAISNLVVRKAVSLLAEGVRDGAVARATGDYLYTERGGKVTAELFIASVDLVSQTLVISRNARCPALLRQGGEMMTLALPSEAVGAHRNSKPAITELPLTNDTLVVICTDGVWDAGETAGKRIDVAAQLQEIDPRHSVDAQTLADTILAEALRLDSNRPRDDATVVIVRIAPHEREQEIRRMTVRFPI